MIKRFMIGAFLLLLMTSCTRSPLESRDQAFRKVDPQNWPELKDDLPLQPLVLGIKDQIKTHQRKNGEALLFLNNSLSRKNYIRGLQRLVDTFEKDGEDAFWNALKTRFDLYEVYGGKKWGEVLATGYFEPIIEGALHRTNKFTKPLYKTPPDMVEVDLRSFGDYFKDFDKVSRPIVGRLLPEKKNGVLQVKQYYSREEIEGKAQSLKGRHLELCWVDPVDGFFFEIQGSGQVQISKNRTISLSYAAQNGHAYDAIGKYLLDVIPKEEMSLQTIRSHLNSLPNDQRDAILHRNASLVFFQKRKGSPVTYFGTDAVAGRTIATDDRFFPKGTLAFFQFELPQAAPPQVWTSRLVLDQDRGGAIRGGGRVDLFWGSGPEAEKHAGPMRSEGRLYYFVPKDDKQISI